MANKKQFSLIVFYRIERGKTTFSTILKLLRKLNFQKRIHTDDIYVFIDCITFLRSRPNLYRKSNQPKCNEFSCGVTRL